MSGKLSDKFASLVPAAPKSAVKPNARSSGTISDRIREMRTNNRVTTQKNQRQAQTQQRRTGAPLAANNGSKSANSRPRGLVQRGASRPVRPNSAKSAVMGGAGKVGKGGKPQRNGGRRGGKGEKKKPVSAEDLDKEMDTYWYQGGKGPNPEVAKLDQEMDAYFQQKKTGQEQTEGEETMATSS